MSGPDWCRFYPAKWLTGTFCLTNEQRGVYIQIVAIIMDRGECPADFRYLGRVCNLRGHCVKRIVEELIAAGKIVESGAKLHQNRAETERELALNFSATQRLKALKGWQTKHIVDANRQSQPQPQPHLESLSSSKEDDSPRGLNGHGEHPQKWSVKQTDEALALWHRELGDVLCHVIKLTPARRQAIRGRLSDLGSLDAWQLYCRKIRRTPFLVGENVRRWQADFDWTVKQANMAKILEGKYERQVV